MDVGARPLERDSHPHATKRWMGLTYAAHEPMMRRIALGRLGDATAAGDVVHDVFVQLWLHPEQFDETRGSIRTFLAMRTRSRCIDVYRSSAARVRRERQAESRTIGGCVDAVVDSTLTSQVVSASLKTLSPDQRQCIALAFFGGLSYQETARALNLPEGTVKSRIRAALKAMRKGFDHTVDCWDTG